LTRFDGLNRLVLGLLTSTSLDFNSLLCGYKGYGRRPAGAIRHVFAHHAYTFPYTALENNPVFPRAASGTLLSLFANRVVRARRWAERPRERQVGGKRQFVPIDGERDGGRLAETVAELQGDGGRFMLRQASAVRLTLPDDVVDFVISDPPYFDSVQYGDLSAFFRAWLPALAPGEEYGLNWRYDLADSAVESPDVNGQPAHEGRYAELLTAIFRECHRVLNKDSGRLIFTYHHWRAPAWAALTLALRRAQFRLVNRYVVHAENPISVHIANLNALTDDALLVLAPASAGVDRVWERPPAVDGGSSAGFSRDCASLLGWLLRTDLAEGELQKTWQEALAG
jgi:putative DNA methylase